MISIDMRDRDAEVLFEELNGQNIFKSVCCSFLGSSFRFRKGVFIHRMRKIPLPHVIFMYYFLLFFFRRSIQNVSLHLFPALIPCFKILIHGAYIYIVLAFPKANTHLTVHFLQAKVIQCFHLKKCKHSTYIACNLWIQ